MGTYPHVITPCHRSRLPRRVIALDCEPVDPDSQSHSLGAWSASCMDHGPYSSASTETASGTNPTECLEVIEGLSSRRHPTWLVAHNVGYDLTLLGLWQRYREYGWKLTTYTIDDPPTVLRFNTPAGRLIIVDLLNYIRKPIWEIAADCGFESLDPEDRRAVCHRSIDLARLDAQTTLAAMVGIIDWSREHARGCFGTTSASIAWGAYRATSCQSDVTLHCDSRATALERAAYFGGRADCFRIGAIEEITYVLDCNSLYGHVMQSCPLPVELRWCRDSSLDEVRYAVEGGYGAIIDADLCAHSDDYPYRQGRRAVYARGRFRTVLAGAEAARAIRSGDVRRVRSAAVYRLGFPFKSFVERYYERRLQHKADGDLIGAALCKSAIVGLAGKWAQTRKQWAPADKVRPVSDYGYFWGRETDSGEYRRCRAVCGSVEIECDGGEWQHSFPAISAFVTAAARVQMDHYREIAGERRYWYQDTDSLHVSSDGYTALQAAGAISGTRLGALRAESRADRAVYHGVKDYRCGDRRARSGAKPTGSEVADGTWLQDEYQTLGTLLRSEPANAIRVNTRELKRRKPWFSGRVDPDGFVRPLVLPVQ